MGWFSNIVDTITGDKQARLNEEIRQAGLRKINQDNLTAQQHIADQEAARLEAERARTASTIAGGRSAIDSAFSQFDDGYFDNIAKTYVNAQTPQIDDQYAKASDRLKSVLAGQGTLSSSIGANRMAELADKAASARAGAANSGRDFANSVRGNVTSARDQLYSLNTGAVDPNQIGQQATGSATALARSSASTPPPAVGDLFSSLLPPVANAFQANQNSSKPFRFGVSTAAPTSGSGSSRVIG